MKKIFPSNTQNINSFQQLEYENTTALKMRQSTISKPPLSIVPSEANQTYQQIIEKNKLLYLEYYSKFNEMRFMENMAGLKSKPQKQSLLENFLNMLDDMIACLNIIQNTLLLINFDVPDFLQLYNVSPSTMADLLFKDIKTLEGLHLEMIFSSSLRFLETVLEALEFNAELSNNLYQFDVKQWAHTCYNHLNNFMITQQQIKHSKTYCCCCFK